MRLNELVSVALQMVNDAEGNGLRPEDIDVMTITDRGTVKVIKGSRVFDARTQGPVLLIK